MSPRDWRNLILELVQRVIPFEIDVFMAAEHMQRIFVHKYHLCFEQTNNSLLAIFANVS